MEFITIETSTIKLDQFLKWAGIVTTGGEAKNFINQGLIKVNNNLEIKRGRTLKVGDIIEVDNIGIYKIEPSNC